MTIKKCNDCKEDKEITQFFRDKNNKTDGRYSLCKACKQKKTMQWRDLNKGYYNEYMRKKNKESYPIDRLRRYGLTVQQHEQMLIEQNNVCKICKNPPKGTRPLVVDHCHKTNKVRGLLCYGCNRLIVTLDEHPLLNDIIMYLKKD